MPLSLTWIFADAPYFMNRDLQILGDVTIDTSTVPPGHTFYIRVLQPAGFNPLGIQVTGSFTTSPPWPGGSPVVIEPVTVGSHYATGLPENGFCPSDSNPPGDPDQPPLPDTAAKGDWGQFKFAAGSSGDMGYLWLRYGGGQSTIVSPPLEGGLIVESSSPTLRDLVIEFVEGDGLRIDGSPLATQPDIDFLTIEGADGFAVVMHPSFTGLGTTTDFIDNGVDAVNVNTGSIPQAAGVVNWPSVTGSYVVSGDIRIEAGATLILDPGAVVKFTTVQSGFTASGRLEFGTALSGAAGAPVILTDFADDTAGVFGPIDCGTPAGMGEPVCDTNNDGLSVGGAGAWNQVRFGIGASGFLDNVEIRFAGSDPTGGALHIQSSSLRDGSDGISGNADDCDDLFRATDGAGSFKDGSVGSCIVMSELFVTDAGGHGVVVDGQPDTYPVFRDSVITATAIYPLRQIPSYTGLSDVQNDFYGDRNRICPWDSGLAMCAAATPVDTYQGIALMLGRVETGDTASIRRMSRGDLGTHALSTDMPYVITQDIAIEQGGILSIAPDSFLKFEGQSAGISASGTLCAGSVWSTGTLSCDPLGGSGAVFTSLAADDLSGEGDTNGDGVSAPAPGDWRGIDFSSTSTDSALLFSSVRYAGDGLGAGVLVDGALVLVLDNEITDTAGHAIEVRGDVSELIDGTGTDLVRLGIRRNTLLRNTDAPLSLPVFSSVCGHDDFLAGCAAAGGDQNFIPLPGTVDSNGVSGIEFHSLGTTTIPGGLLNPVSWPTLCFVAAPACSPGAGTSVPYLITDLVTVAEGAELILDEGLVAKVDGGASGLLVNGSLTAATAPLLGGSADVVFTSRFDDDFDGDGVANPTGDTDGAGPSLGAPGDWGSLSFVRTPGAVGCPASYPISHPGAAPVTGPCGRIFGFTLLYGGFGSRGINPGDLLDDGNLMVDTADAIILDGMRTAFSAENGAVFRINEQDGGLPGTFPIVQDSVFESNRAYPVAAHPSLGVANLCDSSGFGANGVDDFGLGDDCPANTFIIDPGAGPLTEFLGIALTGGTLRNSVVGPDSTWSLNLEDGTGDPMAIFVTADLAVAVGAELAVNSGTIIKMGDPYPYDSGNGPELANTNVDLLVEGVLTVRGTGPSPVVLTSVSDDCMGSIDPVTAACTGVVVDSNRDLFTTGGRGDWGSLRVRTQISGLLSDLRVLYGGGGIWSGAVFVSGPSQASAVFTFADAEIAYSGGHGLSGSNDFNLDVLPGTSIHHNDGRGISMSDSPFTISGSPVNPTKVQDNGSDGIYVEFTQDPVMDGVIVQDNAGWGIYVFGGDADLAIGSCPFLQPFPNIISSSDTTQVLRNGLGGVRFENVFDFVLSGAEINENGYGASVTGVDDGHGVDFVMTDQDDLACLPPTQTRGEMLNNTVNQNAWRGVAIRNERESITSNLLTPDILNNHIERNSGGGIYVKHTGPFLFSNEIWNNSSEVVPGTTDQGVGHGLFVHLDRPDSVGLPITAFVVPGQMSGADSGKHAATEPRVQSNDFRDNSPYQARVPAGVEMGDHPNRPQGNTFTKTAPDTLPCISPCVRNAVQIYGWLIRDEFTGDTATGTADPDAVGASYPTTITPDTAWGPLSGSTGGVPLAGTVPYILTNDIVVMEISGGTPPAAEGVLFSPVYLQVSDAIIKVTEPEDPSWSQVAVDIHNHSLLVIDDTFIVSFHDDSRGGQQDFDTPEFGVVNRPPAPGDWGGIRFYDGALDFWESWLDVDDECEGISNISGSFGGGTMYPGGFGEVPTFNENPCFTWTDHPHTYEGTNIDDDESCTTLCDWYPFATFSASGAASMISRLFNTVVDFGGDGLEGMVWAQNSSPLYGFSDFDNSLVYGMYIDGNNNNNALGALSLCAGPLCSVPYAARGNSTHPRAQVTAAGNLSGDCLFVRGGGSGLVAGVTCTPF
ncbi:right-handed parallel beta-helix repeat-containing protein [bacterium]|nr:right-handed parallel beta-helix repeat-containing protein [bacterium]